MQIQTRKPCPKCGGIETPEQAEKIRDNKYLCEGCTDGYIYEWVEVEEEEVLINVFIEQQKGCGTVKELSKKIFTTK